MIRRLLPLVFIACSPKPIALHPTTPPPARAALPEGPEIADQIMGFLVISDGAKLAQQLNPQSADADADLARTLGVDVPLARAIDLKRPLAVAMLNPSLLASPSVRPYVALLPIHSRQDALRVMATRGTVVTTEWGAEWITPESRIFVGFERDHAVVAWRKDLLGPALRLLLPKLRERAEAPLRVHLDLQNLYGAFGPQIETLVTRFASQGDAQVGYGLRQVRTLAPYLKSFSGVDVYADLDSGGLTLSVGVDGKPGGSWADYVQQQRPGPAWGVRFLPRDAVLAFVTTASPIARAHDSAALVDYMASLSTVSEQGRSALGRALDAMQGELAYAVWPARGGGVGVGGAYRLSDPGGAREAINSAYQELALPLSSVALRGLALDPARFARRVNVKRSKAQISGVEVDLMEVNVKWPPGSEAQRRTFEVMFGPQLVMATAYVGEDALFALGADYAERLNTMIKVAHGEGASSLGDEPSFVEALSYRDQDRVSLTYLDTARMAQFAAGLMSETRDLAPREQAAVAALLKEVGRGAIVSTTNASGSKYQLTTHLPPGAVAGAAQLHGALWRIALSPLLNPPMMPPMPVPPPQVAPTVPEAAPM